MKQSPGITIFTAPKPFTNPHIDIIQRNAIRSWAALGEGVHVVMLGDETGVVEAGKEMGVEVIADVKRNSSGTPMVSSLFSLALNAASHSIMAYVNADILLLPDFLIAINQVAANTKQFLMVGQRWDLEVNQPIDFSSGWQESLKKDCSEKGILHKPSGSDYFVYPRECFADIPDFAIGRAGWDNWMIYEARRKGWKTIDATSSIQIIHQNHDYAHLPGGQSHYQLPETAENVRMAGGARHIFTLQDVNWKLEQGKISRKKLSASALTREIEIFPLTTIHSELLAFISFSIFHPKKAYVEVRKYLRKNRLIKPSSKWLLDGPS